MKRNVIRLNEGQFRRVIRESVKKVLSEVYMDDIGDFLDSYQPNDDYSDEEYNKANQIISELIDDLDITYREFIAKHQQSANSEYPMPSDISSAEWEDWYNYALDNNWKKRMEDYYAGEMQSKVINQYLNQ